MRRPKPSTVSRRLSVLATFYRTCVIDGVLEHAPAEYVRRPHVPPESPTLGLSHLQFEAMLTAGRDSANPNDFALVAMLGLLGLRIFEATGSDIAALGEARGHRVLKVLGKGDKTALIPLPPAVGRAVDRAVDGRIAGPILRNRAGRRMARHAATRRLRNLATAAGISTARMHPHVLRHTFVTTMLDAGVDLRDVRIAARPPCRPANHHALRPSSQQPRPPPQLHPRGVHGLGNLRTSHADVRAVAPGVAGTFAGVVRACSIEPVERMLVDESRRDLRDPVRGRPVRVYDWSPRAERGSSLIVVSTAPAGRVATWDGWHSRSSPQASGC